MRLIKAGLAGKRTSIGLHQIAHQAPSTDYFLSSNGRARFRRSAYYPAIAPFFYLRVFPYSPLWVKMVFNNEVKYRKIMDFVCLKSISPLFFFHSVICRAPIRLFSHGGSVAAFNNQVVKDGCVVR